MRAAHAAASAALTARSAGFTGRSVPCAPAKPAMAPRHPRGSARASLDASVADGVILSITSTIKYGAPLYNKGEAKECAALYRQAALSIVRDPTVRSDPIKKRLRDAVAEAERILEAGTEDPDVTERRMHEKCAWALRRGLDDVVDSLVNPPIDEPRVFEAMREGDEDDNKGDAADATPSGASAPMVETSTAALFDFAANAGAADQFRSMHDVVMGGASDGSMRPCTNEKGEVFATFQGTIRSDNNGGFASVRCSLGSGIDLSQFEGFYVDARAADAATAAKQILFVAKDAECMTTQVNFKAAFKVGFEGDRGGTAGSFERIKIPFAAFDRPERMGRAVMRGPLKANAVCEVGLMVLKEFGDFGVDVAAIGMYK